MSKQIEIFGIVISKEEAIALRTIFRSDEWNKTISRIFEKVSDMYVGNTVKNIKCNDSLAFYRAQGACDALSVIASIPDIIEDELR